MVMMMTGNLHFVLLKINDTDICQLQQEQRDVAALGRLLTENPEENVVLQLKRKAGYWASKSAAVGDNEETEISKRICYLKIQQNVDSDETLATNVEGTTNNDGSSPAPKPMEIIMNLYFPNTVSDEGFVQSKSTQTDDMAYYVHEQLRNIQKDTERLIEEEHNLFEQSLAPEIDIEEITLRKTHSHERLGLTVCYSNGEEYGESGVDGGAGSGGSGNEVYGGSSVTEVYISDIHADSVAGRDGRLRQGDQILQINGKDITTREETETLIAENNNAVTLLVSRYLYGEDDFNDPSTNEDDDEVLVVEDDEDDDDEEYYDENNMTYVNCMTNNDCCLNNVDDFDKALLSQVEQQHQEPTNENIEPAANNMPKEKTKNPKNDRKTSSILRQNSNSTNLTATATNVISNMDTATKSISSSTRNAAENKTSDYYESEHIYETIPEDPESEPFYCSPYDSSVYVTAIASCSSSTMTDALQHQMQQHKQRVVQWLGINPSHGICHTALPRHAGRNTSGGGGRSLKSRHKISSVGTMRSTVTSLTNGSSLDGGIGSAMTLPASQVDDQDNSSSAYNTGGSNNSVSPHSVVLTGKLRGPDVYTNTPSGVPSLAATTSTDDVVVMQQILMQQHKLANQNKILSPKDKNKITSPKSANKLPFVEQNIGIGGKSSGGITYNSNDTTNIQRSSMVQQHLIKQSPLSIDKIGAPQQLSYYQHQVATNNEQMHCPQFTAPNLSQYHFVSSQEVNNLSLNNKIPKSSPTVAETAANSSNVKKDGEEEAMVWKVKRRPDGTRYIVRRPAKSRVIKERNVRLNVERLRDDVTTTEDDTMSEIKTGRYWTREERKKHIEKAKERRQQQQMQYQQQLQQQLNKTADATVTDNHTHFLSFSRQKYRQHYQLQFNTAQAEAAAQKHKSSLNYSSQAPNNLHDDSSTCGVGAVEQSDNVTNMSATVTVNPTPGNHMMTATSNERNNLNSNMVSVTTV